MVRTNDPLPREISDNCFAVRIRKLNRMVTSVYDDCLRDFGLTVAQFNLLVAIGSFDKVSPTTIANLLSLEKSSLSRNIDKMKTKGWVELLPGQDLRSHDIALTSSGRALLKKSKPAWDRAQAQTREIFGDGLSDLLENISWR